MNDRIQFVCQPHLDDKGEFTWPADETDRNELASRLFGACVIAGMDYWIEQALPAMQEFSADQQSKIKKLLFQTVSGVVFSILVKLDQFPHANLDLVLSNLENDAKIASIIEGDIFDLHDRLANWLDEFSNFPAEFCGQP